MNAIEKAIILLRDIESQDGYTVADELEDLLNQEPICYINTAYVPTLYQGVAMNPGDALYAAPVSAEPVNARLLDVATGLLDWIDSVPKDTALPSMPGIDRDYVDSVISEADEQAKPSPELTDARIQKLWNENADHTPNWNRHNAFARAIERELRREWK